MKIFGPFRQLLPMHAMPLKGAVQDIPVIPDAGVVTQEEKIVQVGNFDELRKSYTGAIEDPSGRGMIVLPGFIDAHTHICWGGDRSMDYADRLAGKSYLEIAARGGGIWSSVLHTREASREDLAELTAARALRHFTDGVTTIEVKSGYGLDVANELKILEAIGLAHQQTIPDLLPTCLAAHIKPRDFEGSNMTYLNRLITHLLPEIKRKSLSNRVDIFIEESAFTPEEGRYYLRAADELGFELTVHADQFSCGGSEVGVDLGAISVDHLEASGDHEIHRIASSDSIAMALPGASLGLGMNYTPARKLLDSGASLVIASDWNPGSAPMGDLLMQAAVLGAAEKLSMAETLAAITFRAAAALNLYDRGQLQPGYLADIQAYDLDDYRGILYNQGKVKPSVVWKNGIPYVN